MENRQGKIEGKSESLAKNGKKYWTFTVDGKKYNTFSETIAKNFGTGDHVEMEGEQQGAFWNMTAMTKMDVRNGPVDVPVVKPGTPSKEPKAFHLSPEQVRSNALASAIEISNKNGDLKVLELATTFEEYIKNGYTADKGKESESDTKDAE